MTEILNPKVEAFGLVDVALLGVTKVAFEQLAAPVIGNGTLMSGGLKTIGGGLVHTMIKGKAGNIVGGAMVVDGMEDLAIALLGGVLGRATGAAGGNGQEAW